MKHSVKSFFQSFDRYLLTISIILLLLMGGSFGASVYFDRAKNPFWNNYSSNVAVTSLSFVIAIFVIEAIQKRKAKKAWQIAETILNEKIKRFTTYFLHTVSITYSYYDEEMLNPINGMVDFEKFGEKALKGLKAHLQNGATANRSDYKSLQTMFPLFYEDLEEIINYIPMIPDQAELTGNLLRIEEYYKQSAALLRANLAGSKFIYMGNIQDSEMDELKKYLCQMMDLFIELRH